MKIIDLLNKIAKGEEVPVKIKYGGQIYLKKEDEENDVKYYENDTYLFLSTINSTAVLNNEVEIIEEQEEIDIQETNWEEIGETLGKIYLELGKGFAKAVKQLDNKLKGE